MSAPARLMRRRARPETDNDGPLDPEDRERPPPPYDPNDYEDLQERWEDRGA